MVQKRNNRKQIISYTSQTDEYVDGFVDTNYTEYNITDFDNIINNQPLSLLQPIPSLEPFIIQKNSILPVRFKFQWNGEIIRIGTQISGSGGTIYYYIENGKYYRISGRGLFSAIASKLNKPLGFRINNNYDYSTSARAFDYGQNQYGIYDTQSYTRKTNAYLDSFENGGTVIWTDLVGTPNNIIQIDYELNPPVPGPQQLLKEGEDINVVGIAHTRVRWRFLSGAPDTNTSSNGKIDATTTITDQMKNRKSLARIDRDIWIVCNITSIISVKLIYSDNNLPISDTITDNFTISGIDGYIGSRLSSSDRELIWFTNSNNTSYDQFIIPRQLISNNLQKIELFQANPINTTVSTEPPIVIPDDFDFDLDFDFNFDFSGLGSGLFTSDIRLKENIELVGVSRNGINVYRFNYIGSPEIYEGVIAQELLETEYADAVFSDGIYFKVDYSMLDVNFKSIL